MKKHFAAFVALVATFSAWAGIDRTLTVSDPDADGKVTITFGEGGVASTGQALIAAWAPADRGDDVMDWTEFRYVGKLKVLPTDMSRDFTIPETWRTRSGCVRFFLMERHLPFPTYIAYATRPDVPNGGLYINTGIKPDSSLDIVVSFSSSNTSGMCPFGIVGQVYVLQNGVSSYYFDFFGAKDSAKTSGVLDDTYVNVFNEAPPNAANGFVEARLNKNGLFLNGHRHLTFDPSTITETTTSPITLFGRYGGWKQEGTTCSIASAKIWMNGELVRDLVPCQVTSGEVRMYDRKNVAFYSKVNGKNPDGTLISEASFTAAPEIDPVPSDAGVPVSRSRTLVFAPTLTVVSNDKQKGTVVAISEGHDAGLLLAVASKTDAGETYSDWTETLVVAKVAAGENAVTVNLPRTWWQNHYHVRFVWKSIAGLPYDRELTYLHSDALLSGCSNAYVQTGWRPSQDTKAEITARTAVNVCAFGISSYFYLFLNGDKKLYAGFGDQKTSEGVSIEDPAEFVKDFHVWRLDATGGYVDDRTVILFEAAELAESTKGVSVPFRVSDRGALSGKEGNVEVKGAKFWDGDYLGLDLVPCVKDGEVGFYDRVRGTFNAGKQGGAFAAGETVVANGDALAWSPSVELQWGMVLIFK